MQERKNGRSLRTAPKASEPVRRGDSTPSLTPRQRVAFYVGLAVTLGVIFAACWAVM